MKYKKKLLKLASRQKWFDNLKGGDKNAFTRPGSEKK